MRSDWEQVPCQSFGTLHRCFYRSLSTVGGGDVPQPDASSHSWDVGGRGRGQCTCRPNLILAAVVARGSACSRHGVRATASRRAARNRCTPRHVPADHASVTTTPAATGWPCSSAPAAVPASSMPANASVRSHICSTAAGSPSNSICGRFARDAPRAGAFNRRRATPQSAPTAARAARVPRLKARRRRE